MLSSTESVKVRIECCCKWLLCEFIACPNSSSPRALRSVARCTHIISLLTPFSSTSTSSTLDLELTPAMPAIYNLDIFLLCTPPVQTAVPADPNDRASPKEQQPNMKRWKLVKDQLDTKRNAASNNTDSSRPAPPYMGVGSHLHPSPTSTSSHPAPRNTVEVRPPPT